MNSCSKLVALILLLGLLVSPAIAMLGCWSNVTNSQRHPCVPHCPNMAPMMGRMAETGSRSIGEFPPASKCCRVLPSRPEPVSQLVTPNDASTGIATPIHSPVTQVVLSASARYDAPPPPAGPSQSILCTFLI
jgi:hypothetical protein